MGNQCFSCDVIGGGVDMPVAAKCAPARAMGVEWGDRPLPVHRLGHVVIAVFT